MRQRNYRISDLCFFFILFALLPPRAFKIRLLYSLLSLTPSILLVPTSRTFSLHRSPSDTFFFCPFSFFPSPPPPPGILTFSHAPAPYSAFAVFRFCFIFFQCSKEGPFPPYLTPPSRPLLFFFWLRSALRAILFVLTRRLHSIISGRDGSSICPSFPTPPFLFFPSFLALHERVMHELRM